MSQQPTDENQIIETEDGSHSIFSSQFQVNYHSLHGAIQETRHVFIEAGFEDRSPHYASLSILEMGFGSGLNALMTYQAASNAQIEVSYTTLEAYPVGMEYVRQLNYLNLMDADEQTEKDFFRMHQATAGAWVSLTPSFEFCKQIQRFEDFVADKEAYHLIYFDAFAPTTQPELWGIQLMTQMYHALLPDGVLVTYCAKGEFKRTLKSVGFTVENIPGPPGKREMTRARKKKLD